MSNTKVSITEGIGTIDRYKLNIVELEKNTEYTKLAYCIKVDVGNTETGNPFFKFSLIDRYGHLIIGRMFNIENVENKGIVVNNLVNRVVKIGFILNVFAGNESLTIKTIDPVREDAISREEFIGEINNVLDYVEEIHNVSKKVCETFSIINALIVQEHLLDGIEHVSIPELYAGRKGGAVKFSVKLFNMVKSVFDDSDKLDDILAVTLLSELFMYWKYSCNYEENILSLGENINRILSKSDLYVNAIADKAKKMNDVRTIKVCRETKHLMKCYFGYDTPDTFIAKSLTSIRSSLEDSIVLEGIHDSMLDGTYKSVEQNNGTYFKLVKI